MYKVYSRVAQQATFNKPKVIFLKWSKTAIRKNTDLTICLVILMLCSASGINAQSVSDVEKIRLQNSFTFTYKVVKQDLSTPASRAAELAEWQSQYDLVVKQGKMQRTDADRVMRELEKDQQKPRPVENMVVTVSSNGKGKLLCIIDVKKWKRTVLFDGSKTIAVDNNSFMTEFYPQTAYGLFPECPLPGISLPNIPFVKSISKVVDGRDGHSVVHGLIPVAQAVNPPKRMIFVEGEIDLGKHGNSFEPTKSTIKSPSGKQVQTWTFDDYQDFKNARVSSHMSLIGYTNDGVPSIKYDYRLKKISASSLPEANFDPYLIVPNGGEVHDYSNKKAAVFGYKKGQGTFDEQWERQSIIDQQNAEKLKNGQIDGRVKSGAFLLLALLVFAAWSFGKRVSKTKS